MELGNTEAVGVEDHHHGGVGHVHTHFDHGGGDEHIEVAGSEQIHCLFLLGRRHPAMEQANPQVFELVMGKAGVRLFRRGRFQFLGLIDQRADHVCLTTGPNLRANLLPHIVLGH